MNLEESKQKIKASMLEHLKTKGFPAMTDRQILQELAPMWRKLRAEGLLLPGMNFENYQRASHEQQIFASLRDSADNMSKWFGGMR